MLLAIEKALGDPKKMSFHLIPVQSEAAMGGILMDSETLLTLLLAVLNSILIAAMSHCRLALTSRTGEEVTHLTIATVPWKWNEWVLLHARTLRIFHDVR